MTDEVVLSGSNGIWLIELADSGGYDVVHGAVVRAPTEQEAWFVLRQQEGGNLYFRHQYKITHIGNVSWGDLVTEVLLTDLRAG